MTTSNPAFQGTIYQDWAATDRRGTVMTIQGTAVKTMILLAITAVTAGLAVGDKVVVDGADRLRDGEKIVVPPPAGTAPATAAVAAGARRQKPAP